jgi:hypothetical protein
MAQAMDEENRFLLGLTATQVDQTRQSYSLYWRYEHEPKMRAALDLIASGHPSLADVPVFQPILGVLLTHRNL